MIYFDNSATTTYPEALATYTEVATRIWGNPSSLHTQVVKLLVFWKLLGNKLRELIGKKAEEIYFTSGGQKGTTGSRVSLIFSYGKYIIVS